MAVSRQAPRKSEAGGLMYSQDAMLLNVEGTPYYLANGAGKSAIQSTIRELTERVELLRAQGKLTDSTLHEYYGEKRFEQIAESNALEAALSQLAKLSSRCSRGLPSAAMIRVFRGMRRRSPERSTS